MPLVEVESARGIATLTLNRADARNALSIDMCDAIVDAVARVDRDPEARVVVIRGAGKVFCSGADFSAVSGPGALEFLSSFERMLETVARFRLPTIASIHGAALGGGLQLATVCDFRIAAADAKLGIPSPKLGIMVNFENIRRLTLLVGIAVAKEVLMTGRTFSGREGAAIGLVNRAVPPSELATEVEGLADEIAELSPLSVRGVKRAIQLVADHLGAARSQDPEAAAEMDRLVTEAYASEDLVEGLQAMSEKRPPNFHGR